MLTFILPIISKLYPASSTNSNLILSRLQCSIKYLASICLSFVPATTMLIFFPLYQYSINRVDFPHLFFFLNEVTDVFEKRNAAGTRKLDACRKANVPRVEL